MTTDVDIDEKIKLDIREPSVYNVIMLNDDTTPIEWVMGILKEIFRHSTSDAEALTMKIHNEGSAIAGTYKYEIAEQKGIEVTLDARSKGYPLQIKVEAEIE